MNSSGAPAFLDVLAALGVTVAAIVRAQAWAVDRSNLVGNVRFTAVVLRSAPFLARVGAARPPCWRWR